MMEANHYVAFCWYDVSFATSLLCACLYVGGGGGPLFFFFLGFLCRCCVGLWLLGGGGGGRRLYLTSIGCFLQLALNNVKRLLWNVHGTKK